MDHVLMHLSQIKISGFQMAVALRRIESRISRAPPPTPIVTGKGHRSAAIDDLTLSEYLETTLKVPDLTLPESYFPARSPSPVPAEICFDSLVSGDNSAVCRVIEAVTAVGAFRIEGGITKEEVRAAIETFGAVLRFSEEKRKALKLFIIERGDGIQEFEWVRPMSSTTENAWPESYPSFREKVEKFAAKLELVAECIARILSDNIKNRRDTENISNKCAVLCLREHGLHHSEGDQSDIDEHHHSHALSLHLSGDYRELLLIRSQNGSSSIVLPPGSILVTITKELEEWCNGELKSANVEPLPVQSDADGISPFSLEFMCSPQALDQNEHIYPIIKKISVMDQLLILLVLSFLYKLWTLLSSYLTNT